MTLNFGSSCLHLFSAGIAGFCHHTLYTWYRGTKPRALWVLARCSTIRAPSQHSLPFTHPKQTGCHVFEWGGLSTLTCEGGGHFRPWASMFLLGHVWVICSSFGWTCSVHRLVLGSLLKPCWSSSATLSRVSRGRDPFHGGFGISGIFPLHPILFLPAFPDFLPFLFLHPRDPNNSLFFFYFKVPLYYSCKLIWFMLMLFFHLCDIYLEGKAWKGYI